MEKLIMTFASGGKTTVEVRGHKGPGCLELTKKIENALGATIGDEKTREFRETETATETNRLRSSQ